MNDQPSWPKRLFEDRNGPLRESLTVRSIIDRLEQLEKETRPSGGAATSNDKDIKSREAIGWAGELIWHLAGWAVEHQQGLAIHGLKSLGAPTNEMLRDASYVQEKAESDSHANERAAIEAIGRGRQLPPEQQREFSAQIIELLQEHLQEYLFPSSLAEALRALDFGEVQPILRARKLGGEKRNRTERIMQLRALEFISYEEAAGTGKQTAQETVGGHFGVGIEAIRKWEKHISKALTSAFVSRALTRAREDGELAKRVRTHPDEGISLVWPDRYFARMKAAAKLFNKSRKEKRRR